MKVLVATPVYDGKLPVETVRCLLAEQAVAIGGGVDLQIRFLPSCSHPAMGRNQLAQDFLESDADKLVFLDSDVTFEPGSLLKMALKPYDLVGGAYRFKMDQEKYPVMWLKEKELWANEHGLLEVETLPGGFLSISRNVFDAIQKANPLQRYEHLGKVCQAFFAMPFMDGTLYGEDSFFCKSWRDAGGRVYLDPELALTHWDFNKPYPGHIGKWLKGRTGSQPVSIAV